MGRTLHTQSDVRRHMADLASMKGKGSGDDWRESGVGSAVMRALREAIDPASVVTHILDNDSWRPEAARVREVMADLGRTQNARAAAKRQGCRRGAWSGWRAGWTHKRLAGLERVHTWVCACTCELGQYIATARTMSDPPREAHPDADRVRSDLMAAHVVPLLGGEDGLLGWWMQDAGDPWTRPPLVGPLADAPAPPARVGSWQKASR